MDLDQPEEHPTPEESLEETLTEAEMPRPLRRSTPTEPQATLRPPEPPSTRSATSEMPRQPLQQKKSSKRPVHGPWPFEKATPRKPVTGFGPHEEPVPRTRMEVKTEEVLPEVTPENIIESESSAEGALRRSQRTRRPRGFYTEEDPVRQFLRHERTQRYDRR